MYCEKNFKTKKALREAVKSGKRLGVFQPNNLFGSRTPDNGTVCIEGPHYPEPHRWYATVKLEGGFIIKVK